MRLWVHRLHRVWIAWIDEHEIMAFALQRQASKVNHDAGQHKRRDNTCSSKYLHTPSFSRARLLMVLQILSMFAATLDSDAIDTPRTPLAQFRGGYRACASLLRSLGSHYRHDRDVDLYTYQAHNGIRGYQDGAACRAADP
jgi:hypothetical protein